ncbi:MAG: helix-turn-helix domain-containing protein [Steroidobacteraceae bacterium]
MAPPQLLVRAEQAAEMIAVSRATMYLMIRRGDIPSLKIGNLRRVPVGALRAHIDRQLAAAGTRDGRA